MMMIANIIRIIIIKGWKSVDSVKFSCVSDSP